ncbi:MAG TPA: hypothetical protein VEC96_08255, partial [Anaerolineae bacterium]|nr:hypothetical protein [Anaerolineae bacterium]
DRDSTMLLSKLLPQLARLPLLLVLTRRETTTVYQHVSPLPLTKLPDTILAEIAQRALGARALDKTLAGWICRRAGGNPLYVEELCQALQQAEAVLLDRESGEARGIGVEPALPLSLHGLLLARLDELPLTHQDVLKRAAVMGQAFEYAGLLKLCQPQLSEAEVELALEEAVQAAFLTVLQQGVYQFNHPLLQEAIYTTLAFSQRQNWHTQAGDWLFESQPDPDQSLELIAYHYLQGSEVEKAARFARRAGDKARECGAYAGATAYYTKVLALTNASLEERAGAAEGQADVLALQGDYQAAGSAYTQAIELGSLEAIGKQAILSGEADILARTQFTPALRPWAEGARAWLLAQRNQPEAALTLLQAALDTAEEKVRPALAALAQTLAAKRQLGPYEEWLSQFAQIALSQSLPVASFNKL